MLRETIRLRSGLVEVEDHGGFLFVREQGTLADVRELQLYTKHLERFIQQTGTKRAVIDAREEHGEAPADIRQAMWSWLESSERGFEKVAFVLPTEMAVARVNMTALARGVAIRAFDNLFEAQRWLVRRRATTVRDLPPRTRSSRPPPPDRSSSSASTAPPPASGSVGSASLTSRPVARKTASSAPRPSSAYHVTSGREEQIGSTRASAVPRTRSETQALSRPRSSAPPGQDRPSDVHRSVERARDRSPERPLRNPALRDTMPDGEEPDGSGSAGVG